MDNPQLARELLYRNNITIQAGGQVILPPPTKLSRLNLEPDLPGFWTGSDTGKELPRNIKRIDSYATLQNSLGFGIISVKTKVKRFSAQRVEYKLVRLYLNTRAYVNKFPTNTYAQLDVARKQVRLIGPNVNPPLGVSDWVDVIWKREQRKEKSQDVYDIMRNAQKINRAYQHDLFKTKDTEFISIPEIPIQITDANELVCLSQEDIEPRIFIAGDTGMGKSWFKHGMVDRMYWYWDVRPLVMNDSQAETFSYSYANDETPPKPVELLEKFNESPRPLPSVFITPSTKHMEEVAMEEEQLGYAIALPYREVVINAHKYFDLQKSDKYFESVQNQLLLEQEPTPESLRDIFANAVPRPPKGSVNMFWGYMNQLYKQRIVDKWAKLPSMWKVYCYNQLAGVYNPMLACAISGLVPHLLTSEIINKKLFHLYFQYIANDIFEQQDKDPILTKHQFRILFDVDEVMDIAATGQHSPASETLSVIQRRGRFKRIGSVIASQFYKKIQDETKQNCWTVFCFNTKEADEVCNDYGLERRVADRIKDLNKFEFMAYSKMSEFVVYDMDGNKRKDKGPFFGHALAPLSRHMKPIKEVDNGKAKRKRRKKVQMRIL